MGGFGWELRMYTQLGIRLSVEYGYGVFRIWPFLELLLGRSLVEVLERYPGFTLSVADICDGSNGIR